MIAVLLSLFEVITTILGKSYIWGGSILGTPKICSLELITKRLKLVRFLKIIIRYFKVEEYILTQFEILNSLGGLEDIFNCSLNKKTKSFMENYFSKCVAGSLCWLLSKCPSTHLVTALYLHFWQFSLFPTQRNK